MNDKELKTNDRLNDKKFRESIDSIANELTSSNIKFTHSNTTSEGNEGNTNVVNIYIDHSEIMKISDYANSVYDIKLLPTTLSADSYYNDLAKNTNFKSLIDSLLLNKTHINDDVLIDIRRNEKQVIISCQYGY